MQILHRYLIFTAGIYLPCISATLAVVDIQNLFPTQDQQPHQLYPSTPTKNSPWSHTPYCVLSANGKDYCVYTSNTTGEAGISLLMPPSLAHEASLLIENTTLTGFAASQFRSQHLQHQGTQNVVSSDYIVSSYEVQSVPGKGIGVVATRRIKKWETIMVDQAAVVLDLNITKTMRESVGKRMIEKGVMQLRKPDVVLGLSGEHNALKKKGGREDGSMDQVDNILLTNGFGTTVAGAKCRALFPLISRINHDCSPNAYVLFSRAGISMAVKAYRDIEIDEEISISYLTLGQTFPHRHRSLSRWGFTCTCDLCSLSEPEKAASDMRRKLITQLTSQIIQVWEAGDATTAISLAEESVGIIDDEGLEHLLAEQYALVAKLWLMLSKMPGRSTLKGKGDESPREKAEVWARKSWNLLGGMGFLGSKWRDDMEFGLESFLELVGNGVKEIVEIPKIWEHGSTWSFS